MAQFTTAIAESWMSRHPKLMASDEPISPIEESEVMAQVLTREEIRATVVLLREMVAIEIAR